MWTRCLQKLQSGPSRWLAPPTNDVEAAAPFWSDGALIGGVPVEKGAEAPMWKGTPQGGVPMALDPDYTKVEANKPERTPPGGAHIWTNTWTESLMEARWDPIPPQGGGEL